jgi:hypothetical protein
VKAPWKWALGVAAVVAVAAALRLWHLGSWSYWSDEAFTISDANALIDGDGSDHPPAHRLSFLVYGLWFRAARSLGLPLDEYAVRLLPALLGVVGVLCTALLGARAAGRPGALFAALLVALSPFHLYWSQNARSYALEVVLAIPAGLFLGRACMGGKVRDFLIGLVLLGAAAFAHPTALTMAPGLLAFWIYAKWAHAAPSLGARRSWVAVMAAALLGALAISPLGRSIWVHFHVKSGASPALYVSTCAYYFRASLLAGAFVLAVRGALRRDSRSIFFAFVGFGTLAAGFLASCIVRTNSQYVVAALPFLCLLVGREIAQVAWSGAPGMKLAAAAFAATLACDFAGGAFLYHTAERGHRAPWREACQYVWDRADPKDLLVSTQAAIVECYLNPENPRPRDPQTALYINQFESDKFEIATRLSRTSWFLVLDVDLDEWNSRDRSIFETFLREQCRPMADWPLQFAGKNQTLRVWRYDPQ